MLPDLQKNIKIDEIFLRNILIFLLSFSKLTLEPNVTRFAICENKKEYLEKGCNVYEKN